MKEIKTVEDCIKILENVINACNELTVTGPKNAFILSATFGDLSIVKEFLIKHQTE